jgi:hypothetical protein
MCSRRIHNLEPADETVKLKSLLLEKSAGIGLTGCGKTRRMKTATTTNGANFSGILEVLKESAVRTGKKPPQIPPLRYPGFPVEVGGVGELHAAFLNESRTRGRW